MVEIRCSNTSVSFYYEDYMVGKWLVELSGYRHASPVDNKTSSSKHAEHWGLYADRGHLQLAAAQGPGLVKHLLTQASLTCGNCAAPYCPEKAGAWVLWLCNVH